MMLFASSMPVVHAIGSLEDKQEVYTSTVLENKQENVDYRVEFFMLTKESLPEGITVDTETISENQVRQYFYDNNRKTEELTEIKLEDDQVIIDYYDVKNKNKSKIETQIISTEKFNGQYNSNDEITQYGSETGGSYDWQYGSTGYADKVLDGRESLSILTNKAKDFLLSFVPVYSYYSTIQSAADTMAQYAYKGKATTYYSTKRVKYWRQARPTEANNIYGRPYLHSHEYEIKSWSHVTPEKVIKTWQELYYANSY